MNILITKWFKATSMLALFVLASSVHAAAAQYYVSPTGSDDTGDGSINNPWQTPQKALFTIPFSQDDVDINLREGTYVLANTLFFDAQRGGSESGTFRLREYQDETAILDGSLIPNFGAMISISSAHYVTIEGLELTNLIGNKTGIFITGSSTNIRIYRNQIHDMHWTTDPVLKTQPQPSDNLNPLVVLGNLNTPTSAIEIEDNDMYNLTTGYSEGIKVVGNVDGFLIEGNDVHDVANICIVAAGNYPWVGLSDPALNQARNGIIRYNKTWRCVSPIAASAGIYVDGGRDIFVTHNYSYENTVGFSVGCEQPGSASGIVLNRNTAERNTQAGLFIGTISPDAIVDSVIVTENQFNNNYTSPIFGGAPIVMNKVNNLTINNNKLWSNSEFMMTANSPISNLNINHNDYRSKLVAQDNAVFVWAGISGQNYVGFDTYKATTGQDKLSTFQLEP